MLMAAEMSQRLGNLDASVVARLRALAAACRSAGGGAAHRRRSVRSTTCAWTRRSRPAACGWCCCAGLGRAIVTGDYPDAALQRHAGGAFRMSDAGAWRALRARTIRAARAAPLRRAAAAVSQRIPARPRSHHPLQCVPPAGLQDAGVRQPRRRPVPHARDALDRSGADRPLHRARAGAERNARPKRSRWRTIWATRPSVTPGRMR